MNPVRAVREFTGAERFEEARLRLWMAIPPLAAILVARTAISVTSGIGVASLHPEDWARWDSGHYLKIAFDGYHYGDCGQLGMGPEGALCQNTTWYPLLPWLMRLCSAVGLNHAEAGVVIAVLAWVATIVLMWRWFLSRLPPARALAGLSLAVFFPGAVYLQALFPVSLLTLCVVVWAGLMSRKQWKAAAASAAVAGMAYPIGIVLVAATALWVATWAHGSLQARLRAAVVPATIACVGSLVVFIAQEIEVGRWDASFAAQRRGGAHILNPVMSLWHVVIARDVLIQRYPGNGGLARWVAWQTGLVAAIVVLTSMAVVRRWWRQRDTAEISMLAAFVGMWLFPLMTWLETGLYRREATLLPFVVIVAARLPAAVSAALAVGAMVVFGGVTPLFFSSKLV